MPGIPGCLHRGLTWVWFVCFFSSLFFGLTGSGLSACLFCFYFGLFVYFDGWQRHISFLKCLFGCLYIRLNGWHRQCKECQIARVCAQRTDRGLVYLVVIDMFHFLNVCLYIRLNGWQRQCKECQIARVHAQRELTGVWFIW